MGPGMLAGIAVAVFVFGAAAAAGLVHCAHTRKAAPLARPKLVKKPSLFMEENPHAGDERLLRGDVEMAKRASRRVSEYGV